MQNKQSSANRVLQQDIESFSFVRIFTIFKMSGYEIPIGSLEEQALKRKQRLRNLQQKIKTKVESGTENAAVEEMDTGNEENGSGAKPKGEDVVSEMETQMEALKAPFVVEEIDIQNLAPRKPDWDLKRDVSKKLEVLERKTQRAIAELIRDRLKSNEGPSIDLQAVNTVGYSTQIKETKIVQPSVE